MDTADEKQRSGELRSRFAAVSSFVHFNVMIFCLVDLVLEKGSYDINLTSRQTYVGIFLAQMWESRVQKCYEYFTIVSAYFSWIFITRWKSGLGSFVRYIMQFCTKNHSVWRCCRRLLQGMTKRRKWGETLGDGKEKSFFDYEQANARLSFQYENTDILKRYQDPSGKNIIVQRRLH